MFKKSVDERLSAWSSLRNSLSASADPLGDVCEFWSQAPFIPYNKSIDHYNPNSWVSPWEIICENQYDDFTKALMMAWTLKYSKRFQDTHIELRTYINENKTTVYNVVVVDNTTVLNFKDEYPVSFESIDNTFLLENLIEIINRP